MLCILFIYLCLWERNFVNFQKVVHDQDENALLRAYIREWSKYFTQSTYLPMPFNALEKMLVSSKDSTNNQQKKTSKVEEDSEVRKVKKKLNLPVPIYLSALLFYHHSLSICHFRAQWTFDAGILSRDGASEKTAFWESETNSLKYEHCVHNNLCMCMNKIFPWGVARTNYTKTKQCSLMSFYRSANVCLCLPISFALIWTVLYFCFSFT